MITARIETRTRVIPVDTPNDKDAAISRLQNAVCTLIPEDGRCRFVVLDSDHDKVLYSWYYQPTFRQDLAVGAAAEPSEDSSAYDWGIVFYVLRKGEELNYDNFYKNDWGTQADFDYEKSAHDYMRKRGYGRDEYNIVYEYSVWGINDEYTYGFGLGLTKKEARENLNENLAYYHLKLLANGKVKEI